MFFCYFSFAFYLLFFMQCFFMFCFAFNKFYPLHRNHNPRTISPLAYTSNIYTYLAKRSSQTDYSAFTIHFISIQFNFNIHTSSLRYSLPYLTLYSPSGLVCKLLGHSDGLLFGGRLADKQ